jgi:hypothetical protein
MPIKFRCVHCGQYLGISRTKAGTVVDCPACGRSVGVPKKEGEKAERVGRPSLNHDDSQLAEALREVAAIAQSSDMAIPQLPPSFEHVSDGRETREVNVPPPRIIPSAPLPPIKHFDPPPPPRLVPGPADPYADYSDEETAFDTRLPLEELASLAKAEPAPLPLPSAYGQVPWTNEVPWKLWLAFVAVGFAAIVTGFLLGRWDLSMEQDRSARATDDEGEPPSEESSAATEDVYAHLGALAAEGTIKYGEGEGSPITPDAGAWVYAFPIANDTSKKLKSEWFQSDDSARITALQILGGNATKADANGQFQLDLLHKGKYLFVVTSANKSQSKQPPEVLKQYFDDPAAFLGTRAFQSKEWDFPESGTELEFDPF